MNLQDFLKVTQKTHDGDGYSFQEIRPRIVCKDGTSLSVQGSHSHYCFPRKDNDFYQSLEVGFPSLRPPSEWRPYYDGEWQEDTFVGYFVRLWKERSMILHYLKTLNSRGLKRTLSFLDNACAGVYGYVPIEMIETFIENHGGIDEEKSLNVPDFD